MIDILREPDIVLVQTEENSNSVRTLVSFNRTSYGLQVYCQSPEERVRLIELRWKGKISGEAKIFGDAWKQASCRLGWKEVLPNLAFPWYFLISVGKEHRGYGVMTHAKAICFWRITHSEIILCLDVRCGGIGVMLGKRKLHAATIVSEEYEKMPSYRAAGFFCEKMCGYSIMPKVPVYGFSNWCVGEERNSNEETLRAADFLTRLTEDFKNRPYLMIEDGWQEKYMPNGYNGGPWKRGNQNFPDMRDLAMQICDRNLNAGIWFRPLMNKYAEVPREARSFHNTLDPSHPAVLKQVEADISTMCGWGYSLIKYDCTSFDIFGEWGSRELCSEKKSWHFYDGTKTSAEIVMNFYHTVREAAGPYKAVVMGCNTIAHLGTGNMHIYTAGDDRGNPISFAGMQAIVNSLAFRLPQHKKFFYTGLDRLNITDLSSWEKARQAVRLIAYSGMPLFLAMESKFIEEKMERELREILGIASEIHGETEPIDWEETDMPRIWKIDGKCIEFPWNTC